MKIKLPIYLIICLSAMPLTHGNIWMPAIFGDNMVLQRGQPIPIWGSADAGAKITVQIRGKSQSTTANGDGKWRIDLDQIPTGGPHTMTVTAGDETKQFENVMLGEVWVCSGQSNMERAVIQIDNAYLELISAKYPDIRLITVKRNSSQEPLEDFEGQWEPCSRESLMNFSAVGYFFARRIHQTFGVAVGLIDNSWGGSAAEAWLPRETLDADPQYAPLMNWWDDKMEKYSEEDYKADVAAVKAKITTWEANGRKGNKPQYPRDDRHGQKRPANIYNAMVNPILGYGIKGMIWYQGEANSNRAYQYREMFPQVIETMRENWGQGDFPFYWVQLADFRDEVETPVESTWAELREAQTMTLDRLENVGEAVIIDAGEGRDIHPRDKQTVGDRLARIALARDYNYNIPYQSPRMKSVEISGNKALVTFDHVDGNLYAFDVQDVIGFTIAGADRKFVFAEAKLVGKDQVEVWSEEVPAPVAVRYGWADNPVVNLYDDKGLLPVTPFRSDNWPGITIERIIP